VTNTHLWCAAGIETRATIPHELTLAALPWWIEKLKRFETIQIFRLADLPAEARAEKEMLRAQTAQSVIAVPMIYNKALKGFLGFDSVQREKGWADDIIVPLKIVGEIFTNALERQHAEEKLKRRLDEIRTIYQLTDATGRAGAIEEIYEEALNGFQRALHIDRAAILLVDLDNVMRFKSWRGVSEAFCKAVEGYSPWPPTERMPQPKIVLDIEQEMSLKSIQGVLVQQGIRTLGFFPLQYQGKLMGECVICCDAPRQCSSEEIQLAQTIASHIAFAIGRKQAEQALRESEARYRDLVENSEDLICTHDIEGKILSLNRALIRRLGYEQADEIVGRYIADFLAPRMRSLFNSYLYTIGKRGHAHGFMRILTRDGQERILEYDNSLRTEDLDHPIVRGLAHDVTERKLAEKALRQSEQRYRTLVEHLPDGVYRSTPGGKFIEVNPAMVKMLGYKNKEELMAIDIVTQLYFDQRERSKVVDSLRQAGKDEIEVFRLRRKDGQEIWVEDHGRLVYDTAGNVLYHEGILRDVTERRKAEQERLHVEAQLRHAQKMETIGTLAGGFAHDFNNQLIGIIGNVDMALTDVGSNHPAQTILQEARNAAIRCTEMTKALLAFSRKLESQFNPIDLNQVVRESHRLLKHTIPATIDIEIKAAPDLSMVNADDTQMQQVLMNLCVNARDAIFAATPEGEKSKGAGVGKIFIQTRNQLVGQEAARRNLEARPGRFVVLAVADTGSGIPPENLSRIFEPFFTTKEASKGTGLGLSMAFGIVKAHQGWIEVNSRAPAELAKDQAFQTTFEVFLPAIDAAISPSASSPQISATAVGGNETVLVIDDEPVVRETARLMLTRNGYRVFTADNAIAGLELYRTNWKLVDLVLLDLTMPQISGKHALQQICAINPKSRVIVTSGYAAESETGEVMNLGAIAFLQKPYAPAELLQAIREALKK
jgi:PAS domain S-box-containing protein